jgi:protein-tyrosine phosphatase
MAPGIPLISLFRRRSRRERVDRVSPWLFLGPALDEAGYRDLIAQGVTHVVDLREEGSDDATMMAALGFQWCHLPMRDRAAPAPGQVEDLRDWFARDSDDDAVLYIHCHAGLGRTPTVAIALLMHQGVPLADAHRQVRGARPGAQPTAAQDAYLEALAMRLAPPPGWR